MQHENSVEAAGVTTLGGLTALIKALQGEDTKLLAERLERVEQALENPLTILTFQKPTMTMAELGAFMRVHPTTARRWTLLPRDHPDFLPRVSDSPVLVLSADVVDWLQARRNRNG